MFKDIRKPCRITLSMDRVASDGRLTATDEIAGLCEHATEELNSVKDGKDLCVGQKRFVVGQQLGRKYF
jgi:hypothetical protein